MEQELRQLQLKCLEIFDFLDRICKKYDIQYSLCGGSVVGAHLYKGFLPWDDDIDIMMTRKSFNKFLKVALRELPDDYTIVNYHTSDESTTWKICFTKIINKNTTLIQNDGNVMGVFLDIIAYDKVPNNCLKAVDLFLCNRILSINRGKMEGNSLRVRVRNIVLAPILHHRRAYLRFFQKIVEMISLTATSDYTYRELFGAYHYYNMLPYKAAIFENYTTIEFEGRQAMIVRDFVDYLQTRYQRTDFHEPPEKQVAPHYKLLNFDLPYKEYLKGIDGEKGVSGKKDAPV